MAESMFVRCEDCNYENLAQHSFCGMCGARLASPRRAAVPSGAQPQPSPAKTEPVAMQPVAMQPAASLPTASQSTMRGPSLLGLGTEPTARERVNYLLEDEPRAGHWRGWAAAILLAAAVGGSGWYWRTEIRGWIAPASPNSATDTSSNAPTTAAEAESTSAPASQPAATPAPAAAELPNATGSSSGAAAQSATAPSQAVTDAVARAPEVKNDKPADSAANATVAQPSAPTSTPQTTVAPPTKPGVERKTPAADTSTDAMETQGENYLYGHGVDADCGRASKNLLAAAARSSSKAQSVLGTMYATGHCVTRDVPTAYRWFAKALHQDPGNVRIQRDLEVLWTQMTEEERKLAMQTGP
jgi:cytoskeletal protein RodZ